MNDETVKPMRGWFLTFKDRLIYVSHDDIGGPFSACVITLSGIAYELKAKHYLDGVTDGLRYMLDSDDTVNGFAVEYSNGARLEGRIVRSCDTPPHQKLTKWHVDKSGIDPRPEGSRLDAAGRPMPDVIENIMSDVASLWNQTRLPKE